MTSKRERKTFTEEFKKQWSSYLMLASLGLKLLKNRIYHQPHLIVGLDESMPLVRLRSAITEAKRNYILLCCVRKTCGLKWRMTY